MNYLWDYDINALKKTDAGKIKILERMINYGPDKGEKINLAEVRKNWDKLNLFRLQKRLLELILWGHYRPLPKSNKQFIAK
jgi:hypothetical protein